MLFIRCQTVFIYLTSRPMFTATVVLVERFPPQTPAHLHHTCPPAALPSVHVSWNPQERMSALTQPTCVLSPDNQSHQAARGNRSPGHVSRRSLSCNRICSQAPPPPTSFLSYTCTPLILICPSESADPRVHPSYLTSFPV